MKGYIINLEEAAEGNDNFRKVLYTGKHSQLVLMSLKPGEEIGEETHELDQFIRIEAGKGKVVLDGSEYEVEDDFGIVIPATMKHNVINTSDEPLKLYSIYSPPEHKDGIIHVTKDEAEADTDHEFDGKITEPS